MQPFLGALKCCPRAGDTGALHRPVRSAQPPPPLAKILETFLFRQPRGFSKEDRNKEERKNSAIVTTRRDQNYTIHYPITATSSSSTSSTAYRSSNFHPPRQQNHRSRSANPNPGGGGRRCLPANKQTGPRRLCLESILTLLSWSTDR